MDKIANRDFNHIKRMTYQELKALPINDWGFCQNNGFLFIYSLDPSQLYNFTHNGQLRADITMNGGVLATFTNNFSVGSDGTSSLPVYPHRGERKIPDVMHYQKIKLFGRWGGIIERQRLFDMLNEMQQSNATSYFDVLRTLKRFLGKDHLCNRRGGIPLVVGDFMLEHIMLYNVQRILGEETDMIAAHQLRYDKKLQISRGEAYVPYWYKIFIRDPIDFPFSFIKRYKIEVKEMVNAFFREWEKEAGSIRKLTEASSIETVIQRVSIAEPSYDMRHFSSVVASFKMSFADHGDDGDYGLLHFHRWMMIAHSLFSSRKRAGSFDSSSSTALVFNNERQFSRTLTELNKHLIEAGYYLVIRTGKSGYVGQDKSLYLFRKTAIDSFGNLFELPREVQKNSDLCAKLTPAWWASNKDLAFWH